MDKSENEQISNSTSNPTSSAPIKVPTTGSSMSKQEVVSSFDPCLFGCSPRSGETLKTSLKLQEMMQNGGSLPGPSLLDGRTAIGATSLQNQYEVKPQGNPDLHNLDTPEAPDVFGGMEL